MPTNPLHNIPSVSELLESPQLRKLVGRIKLNSVVSTVRAALDEIRTEFQSAASEMTLPSITELADRVARRIVENAAPHARSVINATGLILHPELGQPPLAQEAIEQMTIVTLGYPRLEAGQADNDLSNWQKTAQRLLETLTGAEAALVVNNHTAATMLTLASLKKNSNVIVSRGQIIEMEDGCRLPDLANAVDVVLREVGSTNHTRSDDYVEAIDDQTAALIMIQSTNCAVAGSTSQMPTSQITVEQMVDLGRSHNVPVLFDIGIGGPIKFEQLSSLSQPTASESIAAGVDVVIATADKLLGGPQCGIILGKRKYIQEIANHPMTKACRPDDVTLAGLVATLGLYRDPQHALNAIPVLQLLNTSPENLQNRAQRLAPQIEATKAVAKAEPNQSETFLTGNHMPNDTLITWSISIEPAELKPEAMATELLRGKPAVVARVEGQTLVVDLRTILPCQDLELVAAFDALQPREQPTTDPQTP